MTPRQLTHAKSLARHIREQAAHLVNEMKAIEAIRPDEVAYPGSLSNLKRLLLTDVTYTIDRIRGIQADMLPGLEEE